MEFNLETETNKVVYSFEKQGEQLSFNIINNKKPDIHPTLFKYYALNENSIDALLNNYVYASHPNEINDVFDTFFNLIQFDNENWNYAFLTKILGYPIKKAEEYKKDKNYIAKNFREQLYQQIGVLSLTTKDSDLLMWSYYTNHKGFCIEFDYNKFPFKTHGPFPINYQDKVKPISFTEKLYSSEMLATLVQSNIKYEKWEHEDEWRILIESPCPMISPFYKTGHNRKFRYPISAIKSIALGFRFFDFNNQIDELITISNLEQNIIIKKNEKEKSLILDFIEEHNIPIKLVYENLNNENVFQIAYIICSLKKLNANTYQFLANNNPFINH